jgi:hypothetical protein
LHSESRKTGGNDRVVFVDRMVCKDRNLHLGRAD